MIKHLKEQIYNAALSNQKKREKQNEENKEKPDNVGSLRLTYTHCYIYNR